MTPKIDVDDFVRVEFNSSCLTLSMRAKVIHIPSASGDSWVFEDDESKDVFYVSEGCTVCKKASK